MVGGWDRCNGEVKINTVQIVPSLGSFIVFYEGDSPSLKCWTVLQPRKHSPKYFHRDSVFFGFMTVQFLDLVLGYLLNCFMGKLTKIFLQQQAVLEAPFSTPTNCLIFGKFLWQLLLINSPFWTCLKVFFSAHSLRWMSSRLVTTRCWRSLSFKSVLA